MGRKRKNCPWLEPNCLECPFEDCHASMRDIDRQEAHKRDVETKKMLDQRNKIIFQDYCNGERMTEIASRYNLAYDTIKKIIMRYKRVYNN